MEECLVGLVVKVSASSAEDHGLESRLLGLVGPVSVYCDWVKWNV